jgi:Holliday junction resolvase RusA-like endonuclease
MNGINRCMDCGGDGCALYRSMCSNCFGSGYIFDSRGGEIAYTLPPETNKAVPIGGTKIREFEQERVKMYRTKKILDVEIKGNPIPASRPRFTKSGRAYTAEPYKSYKANLAKKLEMLMGELPEIPDAGTKERTAYLKAHRYQLSLKIYREKAIGDVDNYAKSVMDALQDAGVIANDSQIDTAHIVKRVDKKNPRLCILLEEADDVKR